MKKACLSSTAPPQAVSRSMRIPRGVLAVLLAVPLLSWGAAPPADSHYALRSRKEPKTTRAYLPTVGPIPLRIRRPAAPSVPAVLPPLAMRDPEATTQATRTNLVAEIPTDTAKSNPDEVPEEGGLVDGRNPLEPGGPDGNVSPIVTPGMLVQYFKPAGTNAAGGGISVPVFLPASPPPSTVPGGNVSSATYRSK